MKIKRRELVWLLLPCVALFLWATIIARQSAPNLSLLVRCQEEALSPEPSWKDSDTRVTTNMQTPDGGIAARFQAYKYTFLSGGQTYRWYYNSRIEGIYQGRKQVFYSSTEINKWRCWQASSNSIGWDTHELRERFALAKIPASTTQLNYVIETVAFKSSYVSGEAVGQKRLGQMRHWKNFAGYGVHSVPLER